MATCGDLTFNDTVELGNCFNEGGYTGRFWLMQWHANQWVLTGTEITGNNIDTPRMGGVTGILAGLNVINVKTTGSLSDKTGTPMYGVTVTLPQGFITNAEYQAIVNLVSAGRLTIILERNGSLTDNWFEVIGGESGLLANLAGDSGKKPEDFDVTEITLAGVSGKSMIQLIKASSYTNALAIANGSEF